MVKIMQLDTSRIKKKREEIGNIISIIKNPRVYSDYDRYHFLKAEFDTLTCVLNLLEQEAYKESFVLLRTVFEKFLYFWLMLDGRRYRWTITYNVQPIVSKTPKEARDNTFEHIKREKESGNPKLKDIVEIQRGSGDQELNVTSESEGLYEENDVNQSGELIPVYNFILREYKPDFAHISSIASLMEGTVPSESLLEQIKTQKRYYHHFIYIDKIIRNLLINDLITDDQRIKTNVHYNFLSKFVHPSIAGIEVWENVNRTSTPFSLTSHYDEDTYRELIFLYVARLMFLFLKVFVGHFQKEASSTDYQKYAKLIEELDELSKDLWFFDNEPTDFDRHRHTRRGTEKETQSGVQYYDAQSAPKMIVPMCSNSPI